MMVQGLGVCRMVQLLRSDRVRDADTSWLLFGPTEEPAELADVSPEPSALNDAEPIPAWRFAAE